MARDGYLILDATFHIWSRTIYGPATSMAHIERARRGSLWGQQQKLSDSSEDKGHADTIMGMEVQGLAIPHMARRRAPPRPAASCGAGAAARHPHFQVARGRGFDPDST